MGKELEYKLKVDHTSTLLQIMNDPEITALLQGAFEETAMRTTYYDTGDNRFSRRHCTLRQRQEGDISVICVKISYVFDIRKRYFINFSASKCF